jgi:thiol-disulfide isomerase/thioredoxin
LPEVPPDAGHTSGELPEEPPSPYRNARPDLRINIRSAPALVIPPTPPRVSPESAASGRPAATDPLPVPSCVMLSPRRIDNFALKDIDGLPWEFRRDRRGRLVLLDFWFSTCGPCMRAINHLNELNRTYRDRGLEVIGIACEQDGTPEEKARQVLAVRNRMSIGYRILMAGGDPASLRPCPVCTQLGVMRFPTLKLIDEKGQIVWESEGLDEARLMALKAEIERRLPLTR